MPSDYVNEPERRTPVAAIADVVVAGGGPAGFAAAVAAAREGADTLLLERNSCLGGAATVGLMALWGSRQGVLGLPAQVMDRLTSTGGAVSGGITSFDPEMLKLVMLEMIEEAGAKYLFYTVTTGPIMEADTCRGVIIENKSGRQAILADVVIDATGDADLAAWAGAPYVKGREWDSKTRPMTLMFRMGNVDIRRMVEYAVGHPEQFTNDPSYNVLDVDHGLVKIVGFFDLVEEARRNGEIDQDCHYLRFEGVRVDRGTVFVNTTRIYDRYGADAFDLSLAESEGRKQMMKLVNFMVKRVPGCESAYLIDAATNMGVRETRRIIGDYVFDEQDVVQSRQFEDAIVEIKHRHSVGSELHSPDRGEGAVTDRDHREATRQLVTFQVPYRSLLPQRVEGLLVVGRGMSTSHSGDGYTRGQLACMAIGQAAGVAAALASRNGAVPRRLDVKDLQKQLIRQGVLPEQLAAS